MSKPTQVVAAIAAKLEVPVPEQEIAEATRDIAPEAVLDELDARSTPA